MLKKSNDERLRRNGVLEIVIPFYQIWQEMTNEKTLDIYQYRILTSMSALEELCDVLKKTIAGVFTNDANVESCRTETLYIIKTDLMMEKYYRPIANRLKNSLGTKPKTDAEKTRLLSQAQYAIGKMESTYEHNAMEELKECILTGKMKEMEFYANVVASQAAYNGWSRQALSDLLRFFRNGETFEEQWSLFQQNILCKEKALHDVLINIPFRQQKSENELGTLQGLEIMEVDICTYGQLVQDYSRLQDITNLINAEKRYFRVQVSAFDVYAAAHRAIRTISNVLNMASFYNLVNAWDLSSVSIVVINNVNKYHRSFNAEQLYKTYDYLDSSGGVFENTKKIFIDAEKKVLKEKLTGAFGYANISRASLFQEEKYMNLWIALESLARTKMYQDIISNVKQTVPAAMSLRYTYRIVRNYVEDCLRCNVEFDFGDHIVDMNQETKPNLVMETIEIFQDDQLYEQLLEKSSVNSLLKYRTQMIRSILNDVKELQHKIANHHDRVEWQIQRLYRIRNEIVHSALQNETSLVVYIEHLYDYLATYISEIVNYMSKGKEKTFEETLTIIKDNYDVFIEFIEQGDLQLIEENVLKTGIISLL